MALQLEIAAPPPGDEAVIDPNAALDPEALRLRAEREEAPIIQAVTKALSEADDDRTERADDWVDYYGLYHNKYEFAKTFPFANQMVPPLAYALVETVLPRLVNGLFGSRRWMAFLPREEMDIEGARQAADLVQFETESEIEFEARAIPWLKGACIYGAAISEIGWTEETEEELRREPIQTPAGPVAGAQYVTTKRKKSEPTWTPVSIFDFWIDPQAVGPDAIELSRYVIRREVVRTSDVRARMEGGMLDYVEEVLSPDFAATTSSIPGETDYREERRNRLGLPSTTSHGVLRPGMIELLHYWGEYEDPETHEVTKRRIVLANRKRVVKNEANPFGGRKPFLAFVPNPDPDEFYGVSEIEAISDLLEAYIAEFNQIHDNVNLLLSPMHFIRDGALIDPTEALYPRPGGLIRVDESAMPGRPLSDIMQPVPVPDLRGSALRMFEMLHDLIDRTSGQFDYTRGDRSSTANQTATGITAIIGEANARFRLKIIFGQHQFVKQFGKWLLRLNALYCPPEKAYRVLGQDGAMRYLSIQLDALKPDYDVQPIGAPMLGDSALLRQQLMALGVYMAQNPQFAPYLKPHGFLTQIVELHDVKNTQELVKSEQQVAEEQQAQRVQMMEEENRQRTNAFKDKIVEMELKRKQVTMGDVEAVDGFEAGGATMGGPGSEPTPTGA